MLHLHWWTLLIGVLLGFFVLPPVVGMVRSKMG